MRGVIRTMSVGVFALASSIFGPASSLAVDGCCQFKLNPVFALFGIPPIPFCGNTDDDHCPDPSEDENLADVEHEFFAGKMCASLGQCIAPIAAISTTTTIAKQASDCGTNAAQEAVFAAPGEALVNCHRMCNETPLTLTHFTLIINGVPEFENLVSNLPPTACVNVVRAFSAAALLGTTELQAQWTASDASLFPPVVAPSDSGASLAASVFTETQRAFVIVRAPAPALDRWTILVLAIGLLAIGVGYRRRVLRLSPVAPQA